MWRTVSSSDRCLYALNGARLSSAWGQRPAYVPGNPALDMGTTILP